MNKTDFRVLLVSFNSAWKHGNIGIDQLTGYLREKGFSVDLLHIRTRIEDDKAFEMIQKGYDLYGFSVTSSNYKKCLRISQRIKESCPEAVIEFGGGYASRYFREIFEQTEYLDFVTHGDGEHPTEYLLEELIKGNYNSLLRQTNHYAISSRLDSENKRDYLNTEIPFFPAFDYYEKDTMLRNFRKVHCIQTKNNICTGNCSFCTERHGKISYRPVQDVINQIKHVVNNYGVKKIFFTDDNLFDPNNQQGKEHVKELCLELLKLKSSGYKLVYQCYMKAISVSDTVEDNQLLQLMKEVGFVEIFVGVESGNNEDLLLYNKFTTVSDNYRIIKQLKQNGLFPILGFIGFNPYTTLANIKKNFEFLCDNECTYLPNYLYCFVNINKYTDIYYRAAKDRLLLNDTDYINVPYKYLNSEVQEIADYIQNEMLPRLADIQYETDWIIFTFLEHRIIYGFNDYENELQLIRQNDFAVIKKYLSLIFINNDLNRFKEIEDQFWAHFLQQQQQIKKIYEKMIRLNSISTVLDFYRKKLCLVPSLHFNAAECSDIQVGQITVENQKVISENTCFDCERRENRKLDICNEKEAKTIIFVLENPHIAEFTDGSIQPAKGKTGKNLQKYFIELLEQLSLSNGEYRIILMNSIRYQCSLGLNTNILRDHIWLSLWFNEKLNNDFARRISEYMPDIVLNLSTNGNHSKEDLPDKLPKSYINGKYISYCAPAYSGEDNKTTIRSLITEKIFQACPRCAVYEGSHPSSWFAKRNRNLRKIENPFN